MVPRRYRNATVALVFAGLGAPFSSLAGPQAADPGTDRAGLIRAALGSRFGDSRFDPTADLNHDGVVNVLDVALLRLPERRAARTAVPASITEQILVEPPTVSVQPGAIGAVLLLIRSNVTPLLGYSLDVELVPQAGATGSVTANLVSTNFYPVRNLIAAGGAVLDPTHSVIWDGGNGGVFINAITDDDSTVLAVDGVNDVLAQIFVDASIDAEGEFSIQLGLATALSDGRAFEVPFSFTPAMITVASCVANSDCDDADLCSLDRCMAAACVTSLILYGDVNGDGFVNADDTLCELDTFAGTPDSVACQNGVGELASFEAKDIAPCPAAGDPNNMGDGFVNADDLLAVLDKFAGMVANAACAACVGQSP